jgi:hypothetical protein
MTAGRIAALLARTLVLVVLVASGAYLLIYLYRWEWNRAIISGIFFLAAELALVTAMITGRMRAISARLDRMSDPTELELRARLRAANSRPSQSLEWLRGASSRTSVFLPVLLGSGVLLSGLAFLVERLSSTFANQTVDRRTAHRLSALALPDGGLLSADTTELDDHPPAATRWHRRRVFLGLVALLVALGFTVEWMQDAMETRPEPLAADAETSLTLEIEEKGVQHSTADIALALWTTCRVRLPTTTELEQLTPLDSGHVRLVISPGLGRLRLRRFQGCLEDATLNRVRANVVASQTGSPTGEA